jgi:hypothetical protein
MNKREELQQSIEKTYFMGIETRIMLTALFDHLGLTLTTFGLPEKFDVHDLQKYLKVVKKDPSEKVEPSILIK